MDFSYEVTVFTNLAGGFLGQTAIKIHKNLVEGRHILPLTGHWDSTETTFGSLTIEVSHNK
jgi:hypothetical protein